MKSACVGILSIIAVGHVYREEEKKEKNYQIMN